MNVFNLERLIIPINIYDSHWAVVCINFRRLRIEYYDSFPTFWKPDGIEGTKSLNLCQDSVLTLSP